jgi:hypothetical protein
LGEPVSQRAELRSRRSSGIGTLVKRHKTSTLQAPVIAALLSFSLILSGCADSAQRQAEAGIEPVYDKTTGRLQELRYDSDKNGKADTISYMDGTRVLRIEIDKDEDGKIERWEYYGADQKIEKVGFSRAADGKEDAWSFAAPDGSISRIEISTERDGKITRIEHYAQSVLTRAEEDGDRDGRIDKWETYESDRLTIVAFDTAQRGSPDRRLIYGANGSARLEVDPDGDGVFTAAPPEKSR